MAGLQKILNMKNTQHRKDNVPATFLQIEQAKQEWESTADSLSAVVCLLDQDSQIIRANRAIESWHLGQVRSIKGRSLHALFHPDCRDAACYLSRFVSQAWEQIHQDVPAGCEAWDQVLHRDLSVQLRPLFLPHEKPSPCAGDVAVGIISDITEQKDLERTLQTREEEYHTLVDQIAAAVAIVRQQRLVFINPAFAALFDYTPDELYGVNPLDLFCRRDRDMLSSRLTGFPSTSTDVHWDAIGMTKLGHERWLNIEQTTMTWQGQPAMLLTIQDNTARALREVQLEKEITLLKQQRLSFNPAGIRFQEAVEAFEKHLIPAPWLSIKGISAKPPKH